MQVPDDRHIGGDPGRGFVDRREVMQMQHVSFACSGPFKLP